MLAGLTLAEGMKIPTTAKLHEQARELGSLKMRIKGGKERMVQQTQNVSLSVSSAQFLPSSQHALIHHLHCEKAPHPSELSQVHTPNVPKTQLLQQPEMPQPQFPIFTLYTLYRIPSNVAPLVRFRRAKAPKTALIAIAIRDGFSGLVSLNVAATHTACGGNNRVGVVVVSILEGIVHGGSGRGWMEGGSERGRFGLVET